jgi:microcompartment protein CcmL/EutN
MVRAVLRLRAPGSVAAVQSAVEAGAQVIGAKGMLVNKVVIPSPRPELLNEMI